MLYFIFTHLFLVTVLVGYGEASRMTVPGDPEVEGIGYTRKNLLFVGGVLVHVQFYGERER